MVKYILLLLLLSYVLSFNYLNFDPNAPLDLDYEKPELEGDLLKEMEFIKEVREEGRLTACFVLARNNLVGNNLNVTFTIKNTQLDKGKVLDKILVSMVKNCINNLEDQYIEEVLTVENVSKLSSTHDKILTFDASDVATGPVFSDEENALLRIIYGVEKVEKKQEKLEKEDKSEEEKISQKEDFITFVMTELEKTQTRYFIVGLLISLVTSLLFSQLISLLCKRKKKEVTVVNSKKGFSKKKNK